MWISQKASDEDRSVACLPDRLKAEIAIHVHLDTLKRVDIFQNTEAGFLCELVLRLRPVLFSPGDYVCRKNEVGHEMYIVSRGILEVVTNEGKMVVATLKAGSYFGEISVLNVGSAGNKRTASVRSVGYSDLFCLNKQDLWDVLKNYPNAEARIRARAEERLSKLDINNQQQQQPPQAKPKPRSKTGAAGSRSAALSSLPATPAGPSVLLAATSQHRRRLCSSSSCYRAAQIRRRLDQVTPRACPSCHSWAASTRPPGASKTDDCLSAACCQDLLAARGRRGRLSRASRLQSCSMMHQGRGHKSTAARSSLNNCHMGSLMSTCSAGFGARLAAKTGPPPAPAGPRSAGFGQTQADHHHHSSPLSCSRSFDQRPGAAETSRAGKAARVQPAAAAASGANLIPMGLYRMMIAMIRCPGGPPHWLARGTRKAGPNEPRQKVPPLFRSRLGPAPIRLRRLNPEPKLVLLSLRSNTQLIIAPDIFPDSTLGPTGLASDDASDRPPAAGADRVGHLAQAGDIVLPTGPARQSETSSCASQRPLGTAHRWSSGASIDSSLLSGVGQPAQGCCQSSIRRLGEQQRGEEEEEEGQILDDSYEDDAANLSGHHFRPAQAQPSRPRRTDQRQHSNYQACHCQTHQALDRQAPLVRLQEVQTSVAYQPAAGYYLPAGQLLAGGSPMVQQAALGAQVLQVPLLAPPAATQTAAGRLQMLQPFVAASATASTALQSVSMTHLAVRPTNQMAHSASASASASQEPGGAGHLSASGRPDGDADSSEGPRPRTSNDTSAAESRQGPSSSGSRSEASNHRTGGALEEARGECRIDMSPPNQLASSSSASTRPSSDESSSGPRVASGQVLGQIMPSRDQ